jgi:hypothetical protein
MPQRPGRVALRQAPSRACRATEQAVPTDSSQHLPLLDCAQQAWPPATEVQPSVGQPADQPSVEPLGGRRAPAAVAAEPSRVWGWAYCWLHQAPCARNRREALATTLLVLAVQRQGNPLPAAAAAGRPHSQAAAWTAAQDRPCPLLPAAPLLWGWVALLAGGLSGACGLRAARLVARQGAAGCGAPSRRRPRAPAAAAVPLQPSRHAAAGPRPGRGVGAAGRACLPAPGCRQARSARGRPGAAGGMIACRGSPARRPPCA